MLFRNFNAISMAVLQHLHILTDTEVESSSALWMKALSNQDRRISLILMVSPPLDSNNNTHMP